jgi:hypothetical protein
MKRDEHTKFEKTAGITRYPGIICVMIPRHPDDDVIRTTLICFSTTSSLFTIVDVTGVFQISQLWRMATTRIEPETRILFVGL